LKLLSGQNVDKDKLLSELETAKTRRRNSEDLDSQPIETTGRRGRKGGKFAAL